MRKTQNPPIEYSNTEKNISQSDFLKSCFRCYQFLGFCPLPLAYKTKKPIVANWTKKQSFEPPEGVFNIGWRLGEKIKLRNGKKGYLIALDLDIREKVEVFFSLLRDRVLPFSLVQKTGGEHGGYHAFYLTDYPLETKKIDEGVEIKGKGSQVVVYPSVVKTQYRFIGIFTLDQIISEIAFVDSNSLMNILETYFVSKKQNTNLGSLNTDESKEKEGKGLQLIKEYDAEKIEKNNNIRFQNNQKIDYFEVNKKFGIKHWEKLLARKIVVGKGFLCPFHREKHPSVAIYPSKYGGFHLVDFHERGNRKVYSFLDILKLKKTGKDEHLKPQEAYRLFLGACEEFKVGFHEAYETQKLYERLRKHFYLLTEKQRKILLFILREAKKFESLGLNEMPLSANFMKKKLRISRQTISQALKLFVEVGVLELVKKRETKATIFALNTNLSSKDFIANIKVYKRRGKVKEAEKFISFILAMLFAKVGVDIWYFYLHNLLRWVVIMTMSKKLYRKWKNGKRTMLQIFDNGKWKTIAIVYWDGVSKILRLSFKYENRFRKFRAFAKDKKILGMDFDMVELSFDRRFTKRLTKEEFLDLLIKEDGKIKTIEYGSGEQILINEKKLYSLLGIVDKQGKLFFHYLYRPLIGEPSLRKENSG